MGPQPNENYQDFFIRPLKELSTIPDDATADAAAKAVMGILASAVSEEDARKLTEYLPGPLDMETLRGMQASPTPVSYEMAVIEIARQFQLSEEDAAELTRQVLGKAKAAVGQTTLMEVAGKLGEDWRTLFESV